MFQIPKRTAESSSITLWFPPTNYNYKTNVSPYNSEWLFDLKWSKLILSENTDWSRKLLQPKTVQLFILSTASGSIYERTVFKKNLLGWKICLSKWWKWNSYTKNVGHDGNFYKIPNCNWNRREHLNDKLNKDQNIEINNKF